DCGNRCGVRWIALTSAEGVRGKVAAEKEFYSSVLPYRQTELLAAAHPHELPPSRETLLNIDARMLGIGNGSCGPLPLVRDRITYTPVTLRFVISPGAV